MAELGDEELSLKAPEAREPVQKQFKDIGWYRDERGYKKYGVIPSKDELNEKIRLSPKDSWLYKDNL